MKPWWSRFEEFVGMKTKVEDAPTYEQLGLMVVELETKLKDATDELDKAKARFKFRTTNTRAELAKLVEACEFYADTAHWRPYTLLQRIRAHEDRGHRARVALGRV